MLKASLPKCKVPPISIQPRYTAPPIAAVATMVPPAVATTLCHGFHPGILNPKDHISNTPDAFAEAPPKNQLKLVKKN